MSAPLPLDTPAPAGGPATPLTAYQKKLMFFLSVATFFEGYDFFALAQILPELRSEMSLSPGAAGVMVSVINIGTMLAALLVRTADRWGRRPVLTITILGYTLCSLLTATATNAVSFTGLQLVARIFLVGEWAVAMVYAAEEFPADRRGLVIGVIQACSSLGGIVCAGVVPLLLKTPWGWRSVYVLGAVPLLIMAVARRGIKETSRFEAQKGQVQPQASFTKILHSAHLKRVLLLALIWGCTYVGTHNAITFWKEFAVGERGLTNEQVAGSLTIAALASMPLIFVAGKLLDGLGRRKGAIIMYVACSVGVFLAYSLHDRVGLTLALMVAIYGSTAVLPVMNAYTSELFPTELRSDAFAWANNLLGRIGYVVSPMLVGVAANKIGWGPAVCITTLFPLVGLVLIWFTLPETVGKELEETAKL